MRKLKSVECESNIMSIKFNCLHCKNVTSFDQFTDLINHYVLEHRREYQGKLAKRVR
jgi:hypothetical protein